MKKNLKLVIFDMDGTILNTITDITNSINFTFKHFKFSCKTEKEVAKALGNGGARLVKDLLIDESVSNIDEVIKFYINYYSKNNNITTRPYDGINDLLKALKPHYKLAVVSNKSDHLVKELNNDLFKGFFDLAIGEQDGMKIKPDPEMLNYALSKLNVEKDNALFIGDSEVDILTGKNAKLTTIAVSWGFRSKEELKNYKPDYIVDEVKDLKIIINNL